MCTRSSDTHGRFSTSAARAFANDQKGLFRPDGRMCGGHADTRDTTDLRVEASFEAGAMLIRLMTRSIVINILNPG